MFHRLSAEREKELIEKVARLIVNGGLEDIVGILLEATVPIGDVVGPMSLLVSFPWLPAFFGTTGMDYSILMGLDYRKNGKAILERVKELSEEKEESKWR